MIPNKPIQNITRIQYPTNLHKSWRKGYMQQTYTKHYAQISRNTVRNKLTRNMAQKTIRNKLPQNMMYRPCAANYTKHVAQTICKKMAQNMTHEKNNKPSFNMTHIQIAINLFKT